MGFGLPQIGRFGLRMALVRFRQEGVQLDHKTFLAGMADHEKSGLTARAFERYAGIDEPRYTTLPVTEQLPSPCVSSNTGSLNIAGGLVQLLS